MSWNADAGVETLVSDDVLNFSSEHKNWMRTAHFSTIRAIIAEALRPLGQALEFDSWPLLRRPKPADIKPELLDEEVSALLAAAREEVDRIWSDFQLCKSAEASPLMMRIADIAYKNGGILPQLHSPADGKRKGLARDLYNIHDNEQYHGRKPSSRTWHSWLYATTESIIPFLILLVFGLAGNVMSVVEAKRDLLNTKDDLIRGRRAIVSFKKRRARRILSYSFKDSGKYSVPSLVRQVLELTAPLVAHVPTHQRDRLFLVYSLSGHRKGLDHGAVAPLDAGLATLNLKKFAKRHGLKGSDGADLQITFDMLRPTRINRAFRKTGSILVAKSVAKHRRISTTLAYLKRQQTIQRNRVMLADIQGELVDTALTSLEPLASPFQGATAMAPERNCSDPYRKPAGDSGVLCPDWNYTLTNPNLIVPPEPQFLAALLRDRDAYEEARLNVPLERFEKLWASRFDILNGLIETLSQDGELLMAALEHRSKLSPAPKIR